jgi:FkbM family methyltransferase
VHDSRAFRAHESGGDDEEKLLKPMLCVLRPGDVAYDIGANVGTFTIPLAKYVGQQGQVIAFEPELGAYERLVENIRLNNLTNVRVFCRACGDRDHEAQLFVGGIEGMQSSLLHAVAALRQPSQAVQVVCLDDFRDIEDLPPPRAVKIDVEGNEYAVLKGLSRTLADPACVVMCCEVHPSLFPSGLSVKHIEELLASLGFGHLDPRPRGTEIHLTARKRI